MFSVSPKIKKYLLGMFKFAIDYLLNEVGYNNMHLLTLKHKFYTFFFLLPVDLQQCSIHHPTHIHQQAAM